jgi:hypothetical protein
LADFLHVLCAEGEPDMNVSPISTRGASVPQTEAREGPGPDRVPDGDADDAGAAPVKAAAPAGQGRLVDRSA